MAKINTVTAMTYIENTVVPGISSGYSEDELRQKFAEDTQRLKAENERNLSEYTELLEQDTGGVDINSRIKAMVSTLRADNNAEEDLRQNREMLDKYGEMFSILYKMKEDSAWLNQEVEFTEVDVTKNGDILTQELYFGVSASGDNIVKQPALKVVDGDMEYYIGLMEYHKPNSESQQMKMQISFHEDTLKNLDADKLRRVFDFCEAHGFSYSDMVVRNFDGSVNEAAIQEKMSKLLATAQAARAKEIEEADRREYEQIQYGRSELEELCKYCEEHGEEQKVDFNEMSSDEPSDDRLFTSSYGEQYDNAQHQIDDITNGSMDNTNSMNAASGDSQNGNGHSARLPSFNQGRMLRLIRSLNNRGSDDESHSHKAEELFEKFITNNLGKKKGRSYFKSKTMDGWREFIVYDTEDPDNRKKDAIEDGKGNVKYTYAFKLFIKVDDNDMLHVSYRTPHGKKIDPGVINGIASQFKDLGYTHINFPNGLTDAEKGDWLKALAENGLVPLGISIKKDKAETMLKAAKEKLSAEDYEVYQRRLAKVVKDSTPSARQYKDGLINKGYFAAFTDGYGTTLKGKIKGILRQNDADFGAINKIAAFNTLQLLFDIYKDTSPRSTDGNTAPGRPLYEAAGLSAMEASAIQSSIGNISPDKMNAAQISALFDILYERQKDEAKDALYRRLITERDMKSARNANIIVREVFNNAVGNCDAINEDLVSFGVDEISLIKSTKVDLGIGDYLNNYLPNHQNNTNSQHSASDDFNNRNASAIMNGGNSRN